MLRLARNVRLQTLVDTGHYLLHCSARKPQPADFLIANERLEFNANPKESTN
jgi:hypothetical protein